jgi:hypothetical protein
MVKFLLPRRTETRAGAKYYRRGNHARSAKGSRRPRRGPTFKILVEFDSVEFDENSRRIRVDFAQKPRGNPNNSFRPICYGLV